MLDLDQAVRLFARRSSAVPEAADKDIEHSRVDRPDELDAYVRPLDPADARLDGIQTVELFPHRLIEARPLDELELAAFARNVVDIDEVIALTAAAELDFGPAQPRRSESGGGPLPSQKSGGLGVGLPGRRF